MISNWSPHKYQGSIEQGRRSWGNQGEEELCLNCVHIGVKERTGPLGTSEPVSSLSGFAESFGGSNIFPKQERL